MRRFRHRPGFTLIEILTTVTIMAAVFLGFTVLMYDMAEQMHMSWQMRDAEEYGAWYVSQFIDKVRNGFEPRITRVTTPCEMEVDFTDDSQWDLASGVRDSDVWEFEYSFQTGMPQIRIDDQILEYDFFPPDQDAMDPRDEFWVDPESFIIEPYQGNDLPQDEQEFREDYLTIYFEITYRRQSSIPGRGLYERIIPVTGAAYVINDNWPKLEAPPGFEDE